MHAIDEHSDVKQPLAKRKLLLAVDDSDKCEAALTWLLRELWRPGDELHLVHVVPRPQGQGPASFGAPPVDCLPHQDPVAHKQLVEHAEGFIAHRFLPRLSALEPAPVVHILKADASHDSIGSVVCRKADAVGAAALIMACHTRSSLQEWLIGSVTTFCTQHSKRPVFVVK